MRLNWRILVAVALMSLLWYGIIWLALRAM
jgi:hypothetical protein